MLLKALLRFKRLKEERKRIPFHSKLDLLTVEDQGLIVGVSGRMGFGASLEGVDYLLYSDDRISSFFGELKKWMNQMPEDVVISFMKRSSSDMPGYQQLVGEAVQSTESIAHEIVASKRHALKNQRVVKKELFLFFSYVSPDQKKKKQKNGHPSFSDDGQPEKALKGAEEMVASFLSAL